MAIGLSLVRRTDRIIGADKSDRGYADKSVMSKAPHKKKAPGSPGAQKHDLRLVQRLDIEIHKEFIRMRAQAQRVMLLRFHLDPVVKKVFVKHITLEEELLIRF
jgi:hypothetical protein